MSSFIDLGIRIVILEQVEVISQFLGNGEFGGQFYQIWSALGYIILDLAGKDIIFKYLNPKRVRVWPEKMEIRPQKRKEKIPRTLEGAIFSFHIHWSVKFSMALCNFKIMIVQEIEMKLKWNEKVMAILILRGSFFKYVRDFLTESVSDLSWQCILKGRLCVADERTDIGLFRGICWNSVGSGIVDRGRKKERPYNGPETDKIEWFRKSKNVVTLMRCWRKGVFFLFFSHLFGILRNYSEFRGVHWAFFLI